MYNFCTSSIVNVLQNIKNVFAMLKAILLDISPDMDCKNVEIFFLVNNIIAELQIK